VKLADRVDARKSLVRDSEIRDVPKCRLCEAQTLNSIRKDDEHGCLYARGAR
jgi:hypothetical protein